MSQRHAIVPKCLNYSIQKLELQFLRSLLGLIAMLTLKSHCELARKMIGYNCSHIEAKLQTAPICYKQGMSQFHKTC